MANPTTNYGFVLPTPTDLVTDLPADFDVALQGVDTRLKALQPGTTLGDLAYSSATANTNTRLGIGTTGQVLTVAAGVPSWATPAGGAGLSLVKTQAIGSAVSSVTVTGAFSSTYDNYLITINGGVASANNVIDFQLGTTTTGYYYFGVYGGATSSSVTGENGNNQAFFRYCFSGDTDVLSGQMILQNPNLAKKTMMYSNSARSGTGTINLQFNGSETSTTQHTAFTLTTSTGTITGGTISVYGYAK